MGLGAPKVVAQSVPGRPELCPTLPKLPVGLLRGSLWGLPEFSLGAIFAI